MRPVSTMGSLLGFIIFLITLQSGLTLDTICEVQESCTSCLEANMNCSWCLDVPNKAISARCFEINNLDRSNCDLYITNEHNVSVLQNKNTQDYDPKGEGAVQIKPQKVKLKLVKGHTERLKLTYRPAQNNPLDLYYLMDLSYTMRDDKETLVKIGEELSKALKTFTGNYRIGFGSFADKPAMPFINPKKADNPCSSDGLQCVPTYGFRHHLALTEDIKEFVQQVNGSKITANLDNLEGGFDALMQVAVCKTQIGWNKNARKIVVFVSDGLVHLAGDGKLAGITQRNDKKCHLDKTGEYIGSLIYDYPSLEEMYRELVRSKVSVVFAVTKSVVNTFQKIQALMPEISKVEILSVDSSNILEVIRTSYEAFIKTARFEDNSPPHIRITYESTCGGLYPELKEINVCNNIEMGKNFDFYVNVTMIDYPSDDNYTQIIRIEEAGLSEYLELETEIQKPCPCEEKFVTGANKNYCNDHGSFHCGMCKCEDGWLGNTCNCDSGNATSMKAMEKLCRKSPGAHLCSDRGDCECGMCYCPSGYSGEYCECETCSDCDPEKADCTCDGQCICRYGFYGKKCHCKDGRDKCISPKGEVCSNKGTCYCGECDCDRNFAGKFCEFNLKGSIIENKLCQFFEPCVKCAIEGETDCNITQLCNGTSFEFITEKIVTTSCLVRTTSKEGILCDNHYIYDHEGNGTLKINMQDCTPVDKALIGWGAFIGTVLLGLVILAIAKYCAIIRDRREFLTFQKALDAGRMSEMSPIYVNPITHYTVPKTYDDDF